MRSLLLAWMAGSLVLGGHALAQPAAAAHPYRVVTVDQVGGEGGFDYVYADTAGRRLYIPRLGAEGRITTFDLDTLKPTGDIPKVSGHGVAVDASSGHGFASSKPVAMWDAKTLAMIKSIEVQGNPDGILGDTYRQRIYVLSHAAPNITVINAVDGTVVGVIDLAGAPEQAAADGKGRLFVDIVDKDEIAVVDADSLAVTARYNLVGSCHIPAGLAMDVANHVLFAACRQPAAMAVLNADTGKVLAVLPIGAGVDGTVFNPNTSEAISSQADGTLSVIRELSPTSFALEQTVQTKTGAKTLGLDAKTNNIVSMTADFGPAPPPSATPEPNGRPRRGPMIPGTFEIMLVGR